MLKSNIRHHYNKVSVFIICTIAILAMLSCSGNTRKHQENIALFERMDSLGNACEYKEVLMLGDTLLQRLTAESEDSLRSEVLNWMGMANFYLGNMEDAVRYQQQCFDIDRKTGDAELISSDLNQLTAYCLRTGQNDQARDFILEAIKIEQPLGRNDVLAIRYGMASEVFLKLRDYKKALDYAQKALDIERKAKRNAKIGIRLSQLAAISIEDGKDLSSAQMALEEAVPLLKEANNNNSLAIVYCQLGEIALHENNNTVSQKYYKDALALSRSVGNKFTEKRALQGMWNAMKESAPAQGATYLERYTALADSLTSAEAANNISSLKWQYETRELQLDNERLTVENSMHRILFFAFLLIVALLILITYLLMHSRMSKQRLMRKMEDVRINFFTNITHEFRTPLTAILGLGRDIRDGKMKDKEATVTAADIIVRQGSDLLNLVNQLLDVSKVKSQIGTPDWHYGNIVDYVKMLVEGYRPSAKNKNVDLIFSSIHTKVEIVFAPDYIHKIVGNLLSNALKYSNTGGNIYIELFHRNNNIILRVSDDGIGINADDIKHIFEPFYIGDGSHVEASTGVGLSLVRLLVVALDGKIKVNSMPGKGSVFTVTLPIKEEQEITAPKWEGEGIIDNVISHNTNTITPPNSVGTNNNAPVILIVEDNNDIAYYIGSQLNSNYELVYAHNGQEGFEKAEQLVPDLIITDIMMPEMDGFKMSQKIRNSQLVNHVPIIAITAKASDEDKYKGLSAGVDAYMTKPFNSNELAIRVEKLLEQRNMLREKYSAAIIEGKVEDTELSQNDKDFLRKFVDYVHHSLSENRNIDISECASFLCLSPRQFSRKISALTGSNPTNYINRIKVSRAKQLLDTHPELSIADISSKCGYDDSSYFTRTFKQIEGLTPTQYRNRVK